MIKALRTFRVSPVLPEGLAPLAELSQNLRWAWNPEVQELFRWAEPSLWEDVRGNPVALLGRLDSERLAALASDATFCSRISEAHADLQRYLSERRWAQAQHPSPPRVAYFSPEFGITGAMQTYSGGLGVLAGDHLKAASDLGLALLGVGLLYRHGYFRQNLDANGWQQERYPDLNPFGLPLRRLGHDGDPALVKVVLGSREVACQVWHAAVGRVPLLLLDTDLPQNAPEDRIVTDKLYGGDIEHRLRQEVVLGIGGVRAVRLALELGELDEPPEVYHCNEGHAGFLQLERLRELVEGGLTFDEAVESVRAAALFTTHTPVPAGIDVFPRDLMEHYFGAFAEQCGVTFDRLMALGQPEDDRGHADAYNMALMGLRLSAGANGVSELHGHVARSMFADLWPGFVPEEVPIGHVTNGVHASTWVGREMRAVYERHLAPDWGHNPDAWERVGEIPDDVLWRARGRARERLVQSLREWVRAQAVRRGEQPMTLGWVGELFDPDALTIGFARRFAEYKRGALLLRQPERLRGLLTSSDRPVQIVFAGKAHPRDEIGKSIIRELVHFANSDPQVRGRMVFLEDYDMDVASLLYQGADVWLNNPRRPHEACGTSGMKAVLNGALHCSTLDGWWDECYDGENGFAVGAAGEGFDVEHQDAADAQSLFDLLERTVAPLYYDRDPRAMPRGWLQRVRRSLTTLAPRVLASRMVRQYATELYVPLAAHAGGLEGDKHARARELAAWKRRVRELWDGVAIEWVDGEGRSAALGDRRDVEAVVRLGGLRPEDVRVELLHGPVRADGTLDQPVVAELTAGGEDGGGRWRYTGAFVASHSGEYGLTVRVLPYHDDLYSTADLGLAAWAQGLL